MSNQAHVSTEEISHQTRAVELLQKRIELYKADLTATERARRAFELRMEELRWFSSIG